ncbi:MAG: DUF5606 domain-containing protein [Bacteroidales bacterium]|nr:DUF5606 domain-containing protein [Bacteroidales bacterium]
MILKEILAISGEQGLFKFIAQGKNSIIVEHIETKKRSSFFSSAKVSSLEEILMFTNGEDIPLSKVFDTIYDKENGGPAIDPKSSNEELKAYFETVLPDYDRNRVYVSDMKKLFQWYNFLQRNNMLVKEDPEEEKKEENKEESKQTSEK